MLRIFQRDVTPMVIPGFEVASSGTRSDFGPYNLSNIISRWLSQIDSQGNWDKYGLFVMQIPFHRNGSALVTMANLFPKGKFKTMAEVLENEKFRLVRREALNGVTQIEEGFFKGGYNLPRESVEEIARKVHGEYLDVLMLEPNSAGQYTQQNLAVTLDPRSRFKAVSYWQKTNLVS